MIYIAIIIIIIIVITIITILQWPTKKKIIPVPTH